MILKKLVKLDVQYIDNWSIWMDIYLLFRTVGVVFDRKGKMNYILFGGSGFIGTHLIHLLKECVGPAT